MIELIPLQIWGMIAVDGERVEGYLDSTQVFEVYDVTQVNKRHKKYEFRGTVIRGKKGWMSVIADDDKVVEHRLRRDALGRINNTPRELGGQARGSRLA